MAVSNPSTKLLAVVHVGLLSGVVQTLQQEPLNNVYELHGAALDACRQIMTQTACMTASYKVKVTKDAVDDGGGKAFESLTLVPAATCFMVGNPNLSVFFVCSKTGLRFSFLTNLSSIDGPARVWRWSRPVGPSRGATSRLHVHKYCSGVCALCADVFLKPRNNEKVK